MLSGKDFELIWTNKHSQNLRNYKNTHDNNGNDNGKRANTKE